MIQFVLAQQDAAPGAGFAGLFSIVLIVVIFYMLMYRPMRKRQKNLEAMVTALKKGDRVITTGGIYGTVAGIKDHTVMLKVADQAKIEVAKNAIASMQSAPREAAK